MKIPLQLALIFLLSYIGELISPLIPFPFPAAVVAMILLFILLSLSVVKEKQIEESADFLVKYMGVFFVPITVSVIEYFDLIQQLLLRFVFLAIVTTILTFMATATVSTLVLNLLVKKQEKKYDC